MVQHSQPNSTSKQPSVPNEDLFESTTMTFGEHLEELRRALFRSVVGLVIGFILGLLVANSVVRWIQTPLKEALTTHREILAEQELTSLYGDKIPENLKNYMKNEHIIFEDVLVEVGELKRLAAIATGAKQVADTGDPLLRTVPPPSSKMIKTRVWKPSKADVNAMSVQEPFMIWLKAAFISGLIIASPYIFWQIWSFVAAGLYPHEKRYVYIFLPISLILFWAGAAMAFFFAFKFVLAFLFSFHRALGIQSELRINEWIGFVLMLPLGFGIAFQLPLVMLFLNRIGIFSVEAYIDKWRIAVVAISIISMLLTPADPMSMLLMAIPLTVLYFLGIAMAKWMPRGRSPFSEAYEP